MRDARGNHYSAHLRHSAYRKGPEKPADGHETEPAEKKTEIPSHEEHGREEHTSKTHGTQPHPVTGVHAVHIHHMGGGRAKTHTHRDGGEIEEREHDSLEDAHDHAQNELPGGDQGEPDGDEGAGGGDMGGTMPSSLGSMGA